MIKVFVRTSSVFQKMDISFHVVQYYSSIWCCCLIELPCLDYMHPGSSCSADQVNVVEEKFQNHLFLLSIIPSKAALLCSKLYLALLDCFVFVEKKMESIERAVYVPDSWLSQLLLQ